MILREIYNNLYTLDSRIGVGQGKNIGPGKFVKKNKHRALNYYLATYVLHKKILPPPLLFIKAVGPG